MAKLSLIRRLLKLFHPEGIPWPGTILYNQLSSSEAESSSSASFAA
jgi:hypothetical protein